MVDSKQNAAQGINSPELDNSLKPHARSIKDTQQAANIVKQLVQESADRNRKNARIMAKYNAEPPHKAADLEADGLSWKHNFSTKPLGLLIDKIAPRFSKAIQGVRYLTSSAFPENVPGATAKTELFRSEITETVRARRGWKNFINEFSQENALFGFTAVGWTDKYSWFPRHYRQDECFVPRGTKQNSESAQIVVLRDDFLPHELFSLIHDAKAAESAGWDVKNTVEAINEACPEGISSGFSDYTRIYEDLARELNVGAGYAAGAKVIACYHVFSTEVTGKVSHRILGGEISGLKELFTMDDQFDSMPDAVSFFAFQQGNGTLHGSKGIGREVYAVAGVLDKARNEVVDRLQLSGKVILRTDAKMIKRFRMSVVGNAMLIDNAYEVVQHKIDGSVEPFFQLDAFLTNQLDQIAGTVSPKALEGERVTKAAVDLMAGREEERRDVIIERFLSQFADMMSTIQRRLCDPKTTEDDAKEMQKRLLKFMTREELNQISEQPAASTVANYTDQERQLVALVATEARGNMLYNQKALEREKLTAQLGTKFADKVLMPDEDPTEVAEQTRTAMFEVSAMLEGRAIPVSPRDNHRTHLDTLAPALDATLRVIANDPGAIETLKLLVQHGAAHVDFALAAGADAEAFKEDKKKFDTASKVIAELEEHIAAAEAQSPEALAASAIPDDSEAVPGVNTPML